MPERLRREKLTNVSYHFLWIRTLHKCFSNVGLFIRFINILQSLISSLSPWNWDYAMLHISAKIVYLCLLRIYCWHSFHHALFRLYRQRMHHLNCINTFSHHIRHFLPISKT